MICFEVSKHASPSGLFVRGVPGGKKLTRDLSQFLNFDPYKKFSRWTENEASKT